MRDRRRSFSTSLNFCQTTLYSGIESENEIHVRHKEIIISQRKSKRLKNPRELVCQKTHTNYG